MNASLDRDAPAGAEVVAAWCALLNGGLENPEQLSDCCQIVVKDENLAHEWPVAVVLQGRGGHAAPGWGEQAAATLTVPLAAAARLVREVQEVDYRDPSLVGQILLGGDRALINHVAKALLRPSEDALARMQHATERQAPAYACRKLSRVERPTELEILERIEASEPFIATGLDLPTPCQAWSLALLGARYGQVPLRVRSATERETVAEFVQRVEAALEAERTGVATGPLIEGATKAYTEGCALPEAMRADFMPQHFCLDNYIEPQIWLGAVPTHVPASSLHRDPMDGFLFQIMGRKRLLLFAPDQADRLYPMKAWNNYQPCWVKPEAPDLATFPAFAKARALEVVLHPGELLVQPAGWFHAVYCLDSPTFSVSYFLKH